MPNPDAPGFGNNAAALAEAKLRRQQQRIQQADAALHNPPQVEKPRRDQSRNKAKSVWKPLDITDRAQQRSQERDVDAEARVNKYAAHSRDTSVSRSMSSVSQRTTGAMSVGAFDIDSAAHDDAGFQLYTRRGGRAMKPFVEPSTYSDKPDIEKQKTVEATYDKNEILEVFKQELPSPGFLGTTPGGANGQVQFVQHPNGDVAAHMWSTANFAWDNIGQFSNIRKKTEGQLTGERLKGETAHQKLQQHTLAYFRILAKQREASATGTPFGQDNIKAALPEPPPAASPLRNTSKVVPRDGPETASNHVDMDIRTAHVDVHAFPQRVPAAYRSHERVHTLAPRPDDPFSTGTHDFYNAFKWQSSFGTAASAPPDAQQTHSVHERRHGSAADSTPTREALRDQLHKTVDIATKRSLSQANIARTVLHDPMQASERDEERRRVSPPVFQAGNVNFSSSTSGTKHTNADVRKLCTSWQDSQVYASRNLQIPTDRKTSVLTIGSVPDVDFEPTRTEPPQDCERLRHVIPLQPIAKTVKKSYDEELRDWWTGGSKFARQEELFRTVMNTAPKQPRSGHPPTSGPAQRGATAASENTSSGYNDTITRILIPMYENLASYVQGPPEQRRDYWSRWSHPPDWCIDRGPNGNNSFFDNSWGQPPARVGRDPRFRRDRGDLQFGNLSPMAASTIGTPGAHMGMGRFGFGRY